MRRLAPLALGGTGLLLLALLSGTLSVVAVVSTSMLPTLCPGDRVLVWGPAAETRSGAGDLVVLEDPATGRPLVKRVVAVEGQTVELVDGQLVVDGQRPVEPYVDLESVDGTFFGPVTVPGGAVFVLGDEREHSVDSRDFGAVDRSYVTGRVLGRLGGCAP